MQWATKHYGRTGKAKKTAPVVRGIGRLPPNRAGF